MNLISLSVYSRNDCSDGFGFTLLSDEGSLDFTLATLKENYPLMWQQAALEGTEAELVSELRAQLDQVVESKGNLSINDQWCYIAIGNIWLLTEMGELLNDDFNGPWCTPTERDQFPLSPQADNKNIPVDLQNRMCKE